MGGLSAGSSEKEGDPETDDGDKVHAIPGLSEIGGLFDELFLLTLYARMEGRRFLREERLRVAEDRYGKRILPNRFKPVRRWGRTREARRGLSQGNFGAGGAIRRWKCTVQCCEGYLRTKVQDLLVTVTPLWVLVLQSRSPGSSIHLIGFLDGKVAHRSVLPT